MRSNIEKAAEFGAMMGKKAGLGTLAGVALSRILENLNNPARGAVLGAALGGGGTALYDAIVGNKEDKLKRALMGAGLGGGVGFLAGKKYDYSNMGK